MTTPDLIARLEIHADRCGSGKLPVTAGVLREAIARIRRTEAFEQLLAACQAFADFEQNHASLSFKEFCHRNNEIVEQAKAAIAAASEEPASEPEPQQGATL